MEDSTSGDIEIVRVRCGLGWSKKRL